MLARPMVTKNDITSSLLAPGDLLAGGESISAGALTTVGSGTLTAAMIATGIIYRTGPVGGYTDTTDTATAIIAALAGNFTQAEVVPGTTFRLRFINSVAQAMTFAAGTGVVAGTGTLNVAASLWREYLVTILNASQQQVFQMTGNNGSANLYFGFNVGSGGAAPTGTTMLPISGSNGTGGTFNATPGASATGTNLAASATVIGLIAGQGGVIGVTLSGNNTGAVNGAITFGPSVRFDGLGSGTL